MKTDDRKPGPEADEMKQPAPAADWAGGSTGALLRASESATGLYYQANRADRLRLRGVAMRGACLLLTAALLGCIGAASKVRPSPVGLTTIRVWGDATDVVLVDPLGRVSRSEQLDTDIEIPDFDRWEGGTATTREDSTDASGPRPNYVAVAFELSKPIIGRYQMFAEAKNGGDFSAVVGLHGRNAGTWPCNEVRSDVSKGVGRYVWSIDFLADTSHAKCPVRVSRAGRAPKEKGSRP